MEEGVNSGHCGARVRLWHLFYCLLTEEGWTVRAAMG